MEANGRQGSVWQWALGIAASGAIAIFSIVLTSYGTRLQRVEALAAEVSSIKSTVEQLRAITMERNTQAHEGYQRLARLEAVGEENTKLIKELRDELRDLLKRQ